MGPSSLFSGVSEPVTGYISPNIRKGAIPGENVVWGGKPVKKRPKRGLFKSHQRTVSKGQRFASGKLSLHQP